MLGKRRLANVFVVRLNLPVARAGVRSQKKNLALASESMHLSIRSMN